MVHGKTQNPLFDETFVFDVAYREATRRTLLLKVKDFDKYKRHRVIGQVLLALSDLNIAKGVDTWRRIRPSDQVLCCVN
jgi:Ca2+-dependent lipid-binding protein